MLSKKKIIIVGGGGVIGKKITRAVLEHGATVTVASRNNTEDAFKDLSDDQQRRLDFISVNATDPASVESMMNEAVSRHQRVDAVLNCSFPRNAQFGARFEDVTYEDFCDNVNIHLGAAFLVCQKAAKYFAQTGGGNIVNFSSIYGVMAPRFEIYEGTSMTKEVEYIICKSAIIHMTKYLAKYFKNQNIRVNCISPGGILDGQPESFLKAYNAQSMSKGMLDGEDVTGTAVFLLSDLSTYINGQNIVTDDGFSL